MSEKNSSFYLAILNSIDDFGDSVWIGSKVGTTFYWPLGDHFKKFWKMYFDDSCILTVGAIRKVVKRMMR